MAIRNPSPEELQKLLNKDVVEINNPKEVSKNKNTSDEKNTSPIISYKNELKPKKSRFEPDPIKCHLISNHHYVDEGFLYVRRLNTEEEAKLTGIKDAESLNKIINTIFETAIKSNIPTIEMPLLDKLHVFSFILGISYGDKIQINDLINCKNCRDEYPIEINFLYDLKNNIISNDLKIPFKVVLNSFDKPYELCFNIPKIKDEDSIFNKDISEVISGLIIFLRDENGVDIPREEWKEMMRWLSAEDKKKISDSLNLINSYGDSLEYVINEKCKNPNCCMKGEKVKLKIEDIYLKIMMSIAKK
jgi:hypothetical protein